MDSIQKDNNLASNYSTGNNFPDFIEQGYQVERLLGHNRAGGRVTYLATSIKTERQVVIKQFQFAIIGASWSEYKAHQQEIKVLQQLNSPSIPKYLDSFETSTGFCLVQEYKKAPSLAEAQNFTLEEIEQIAIALLEVLVYLQQQVPTVFHRDIKPENILVDRQSKIKVYLVDFGLAKIGGEEVGASSAVKGTLGFMPPEQIFNRQLTEASDLYSLGTTLICLLTKTKSSDIGNLIDESYCINFKPLLPNLSPLFTDWLSKMVAPNLKNRYPKAAIALNALQSIKLQDRIDSTRQLKKTTTRILLLKFGLFAVCLTSAIATLHILKPITGENAIRQLQETRQCLGCNLREVNLSGMDLKGVDLTGADLTRADLRSAELENVKLTDANLTDADLRGAYLGSANLTAANLTGTNLGSADLRGAIMPDGSVHP
ncbi:serine/threonine-protein kinase [Argonema antarcticum]|uniref:serine/threonine-protein kinase n=1 Tax=Argonema antarcticum TaxID=2942763 RepID=UPI002013A224|nr:serine/threonine-protein kinase [Argonema antarcticum]MCL1471344.1 pentapeptide repeat-containing protein [Argonema antarcticum A004/B2]